MKYVGMAFGLLFALMGFLGLLYVGSPPTFLQMMSLFEGFGLWLGANFLVLSFSVVMVILGVGLFFEAANQ